MKKKFNPRKIETIEYEKIKKVILDDKKNK